MNIRMSTEEKNYSKKQRIIMKKKFTSEEDNLLASLVKQHGESNWKKVAARMIGRTPRQCRERWKYYLCKGENPGFSSSNWTKYEDDLLLEKYIIYGPRWAKIAAFFPNRNDVNLKNRYHKLQRNLIKSSTVHTSSSDGETKK